MDIQLLFLGLGPDCRVVILFGGVNESRDVISETTLLLLCKSSLIGPLHCLSLMLCTCTDSCHGPIATIHYICMMWLLVCLLVEVLWSEP